MLVLAMQFSRGEGGRNRPEGAAKPPPAEPVRATGHSFRTEQRTERCDTIATERMNLRSVVKGDEPN
jgi:hypothetical protein